MNYYTEIVADETLPCSKEDFEELQKLMAYRDDLEDDPDYEYHGMTVEHYNELHMFSDESGTLEAIPADALECIGRIIRKAGKEYWEFGLSYTASRKVPGGFGGKFARIYHDGSLVFSEVKWPDTAPALPTMTIIDHLKAVGDQPFTIQGYQRSDGSVVNLKLRMLPPDGYKQLVQQSIDCIDNFGDLLDRTLWEPVRDEVMISLKKSLMPEELVEKPQRVSHEQITSVSDNLAMLDGDPEKVIVFRTEILSTETVTEPAKVTKSRDEKSAAKKRLMSVLPVGRFCFRLNLYAGKFDKIVL